MSDERVRHGVGTIDLDKGRLYDCQRRDGGRHCFAQYLLGPRERAQESFRERFRMDQNVKTIEGIGSLRGRLLNSVGVRTVDDLLRVGATREGRQRLAGKVGAIEIVEGDICNVRDMMRVSKGAKAIIALAALVGDGAQVLDEA